MAVSLQKIFIIQQKDLLPYVYSNVNDLPLSIFVHSFVVGAVFILATKARRSFFAAGSNLK